MSSLEGRLQADTYKDLFHIENGNLGFDSTLRNVESGNGVSSALNISTLGISVAGTLGVSGVATFDVTPNTNGNDILDTASAPTVSGNWTYSANISANGGFTASISAVSELIVQDHSAPTATSGIQTRDAGGTLRDVGLNVMPPGNVAGAKSISKLDTAFGLRYTGVGASAWDITDDAPDGAVWVIKLAGAGGTINLSDAGVTLTWLDPGGIATGPRVLAAGGVITLHKFATGQYEIWGGGIT